MAQAQWAITQATSISLSSGERYGKLVKPLCAEEEVVQCD